AARWIAGRRRWRSWLGFLGVGGASLAPGVGGCKPRALWDGPERGNARVQVEDPMEQPPISAGWMMNPRYVIDFDRVPAKVAVHFGGEVVAESERCHVLYE